MKVIKKSDGTLIGVFNASNAEREVSALGHVLDECEFIKNQAEKDRENLLYLEETDWLVTRHRDQVGLSAETSLTEQQYQELLHQRQETRELIVDQQALAKYRSLS